jgi:hypothetical protein
MTRNFEMAWGALAALIDLDLVEPGRVDGRVSKDRVRPAVLDRG